MLGYRPRLDDFPPLIQHPGGPLFVFHNIFGRIVAFIGLEPSLLLNILPLFYKKLRKKTFGTWAFLMQRADVGEANAQSNSPAPVPPVSDTIPEDFDTYRAQQVRLVSRWTRGRLLSQQRNSGNTFKCTTISWERKKPVFCEVRGGQFEDAPNWRHRRGNWPAVKTLQKKLMMWKSSEKCQKSVWNGNFSPFVFYHLNCILCRRRRS